MCSSFTIKGDREAAQDKTKMALGALQQKPTATMGLGLAVLAQEAICLQAFGLAACLTPNSSLGKVEHPLRVAVQS